MECNPGNRYLSPLSFAFSVSRFRFWIYTGGAYVVGFALGMENWLAFFEPIYYLYLFTFFFPANILIYGVNDFWDEETDRDNPKKSGREHKLAPHERQLLVRILLLCGAFSLALLFIQDSAERLIFLVFLFLAYFYSAKPLRFKEVPLLDFASNMLYIMPGIFGYFLAAGHYPPALYVVAGFFHIAAMHLFSAIPDVEYDRHAGIRTSAVVFGKKVSLLVCLAFWSCFAALVILLSGYHPLSLLVFLYPLFPALLLLRDSIPIDTLYWYLPYVNTVLGGLLFTALTLTKLTPFPLPGF